MTETDPTLGQLRAWVAQNREDGVTCPCCLRRVKTYPRSIYSGMAAWLIQAHRQHGVEPFYQPKGRTRAPGGDYAKLRHWDLLAGEPGERPDGSKRNGWWRVTSLGSQWVRGLATVPRYAYVANGEVLELGGPAWSVRQALGDRFNYHELIRGGRYVQL